MKHTYNRYPSTVADYRETAHFQQRVAQRHLCDDQIQFALLYGSHMFCGGARVHVVRRQDIPAWIEPKLVHRYHGLVVVTALDQPALLTAYQSPRSYRLLKKKYRN